MLAGKNRRHGPDTAVKLITFFSVFTWLLIIVVLFMVSSAKPSQSSAFFKRSMTPGSEWTLFAAKVLLFIDFLLSIWGIMINSTRNRRKADRFHMSLIISTIVSFVGFILLLIMY